MSACKGARVGFMDDNVKNNDCTIKNYSRMLRPNETL